jgi:hypothetical protein
MYAQVSVWPLNEAGDSPANATARQVAERLSAQPGFQSYLLIRTGESEVVAVTIFDSEPQLEAALAKLSDVMERRIRPLSAGEPMRWRGDVLFNTTADG